MGNGIEQGLTKTSPGKPARPPGLDQGLIGSPFGLGERGRR